MQRYYEYFLSDEPMPELTEAEAIASGYYVTELAGPPRHFQSYLEGELARILYPDTSPSDDLRHHRRERYPDRPYWVFSPTARDGDVKRQTVWEYDANDELQRRNEYVFEPRRTVQTWFFGDGQRGGMLERIYDEHGDQVEVREHAADGRVLVHD